MKTKLFTLLSLIAPTFCYSQTVLFQELFENSNIASRGWYDNTNVVISTIEHIPGSTGSAEFKWLQGATTPTTGGTMRKLFTPSDSVYVSFWVKYSANFTGSNKPYHPHEFYLLTTENTNYTGPAYTYLTAYIEQNEGIPMLALQDGMNIDVSKINQDLTNITENRAVCGCNGVRTAEQASGVDCYAAGGGSYRNGKTWKAGQAYFSDNTGPYYKNDWHNVQAFFKLNTISNGKGNPNGVIRYWYDGQLIIERTNIIMRTAQRPTMKFNQFLIGPYIGDGSPFIQTFWMDNLTVSTGSITTDITGAMDNEAEIIVYPNPFHEFTTVDFSGIKKSSGDNLSFHLYDLLGKEVAAHSDISTDKLLFEKKNLTQGVYFYKVMLNEQYAGSGKLIVQ